MSQQHSSARMGLVRKPGFGPWSMSCLVLNLDLAWDLDGLRVAYRTTWKIWFLF